MGKLKLQDINLRNIDNFLMYKDRVSPATVEFFAYQNIFILLGALFYAEHKILMSFIVVLISIMILRSIFHYSKNNKNSARYTYKYHGIYMGTCSVSCSILACVCLDNFYMSSTMWFFALVLSSGVVTWATFMCVKRKIISNYYRHNSSAMPFEVMIGGSGYFIARSLLDVMELKLIIGLAIACLGLIYSTFIISFIKVYCYDLIQKEKNACEVPKNEMILVVNDDDKRCLKAKDWLDSKNIHYSVRDISAKKVKYHEIKNWHKVSNCSLNDFFATENPMYKRTKLKERLPNMGNREQYEMLSSNNQLIKCPILICSEFALIGFRMDEWEEKLVCEKVCGKEFQNDNPKLL